MSLKRPGWDPTESGHFDDRDDDALEELQFLKEEVAGQVPAFLEHMGLYSEESPLNPIFAAALRIMLEKAVMDDFEEMFDVVIVTDENPEDFELELEGDDEVEVEVHLKPRTPFAELLMAFGQI